MIVGLFTLAPVIVRAGWPYNHDGLRPWLRVAQSAGEWRAGHPIPIWSTVAQFGAGSPGVVLYHKLFGYLGALLHLVGLGPKTVICLTLLSFMVICFLGVARAIRTAAGRSNLPIEMLCGTVAVTSNYAFTDWLTRGAVSEFSAYCVLPWLFAWCLDWLRTGRPTILIGPLLWLLWMAHSAIAAFVWVLLLPCALIAAVAHGRSVIRAIRPLAASVLLFALLAAPFVIAAVPMIRWAQVSNLIGVWRPETTHQPFARIFLDRKWHWGGTWTGFTLQLDPVLIATLVALPAVIVLSGSKRWAGALCLLTALLALALQARVAIPFYRMVPGLEYIAFTWRLLTYLTVSLVIGLGVAILSVEPHLRRASRLLVPILTFGILVVALMGKPRAPGREQPWFSAHALALAAGGIPPDLMSVEPPEYLPRMPSGPGRPRDHWEPAVQSGICRERPIEPSTLETSNQHFSPTCPAGTETELQDFLAPGMRLWTGAGRPVPMHRTCDDPRVRFMSSGTEVQLSMPTLFRTVRDWWNGGPAYSSCTG